MKNKKCICCGKIKSSTRFRCSKHMDGTLVFGKKCKDCYLNDLNNWRKTVEGLVFTIYSHQKSHSNHRGDVLPNYTKHELYDWVVNYDGFYSLYNNWVESGYAKALKPSCDRLNDYKPYTLNNIRVVTWQENNKRSHRDKINGVNNKDSLAVIQETMSGDFVKEHYSIKQAAREVNISDSLIVRCCKGERNHTAGYKWRYVNTE